MIISPVCSLEDVAHGVYVTDGRIVIMFTHFEEGNVWSKTRNDAESSDKYGDNSIMPPLISEEEMDTIDSGDESDDDPMSTEMVE